MERRKQLAIGGFKCSGLGRELGSEGIDAHVELQSIIFSPGG